MASHSENGTSERHKHRLSTSAGFIKLTKAFDSVPREGLFLVPQKFGISPKCWSLLSDFIHSDLVVILVKVKIGNEDVCFESTAGAKQGCTMPDLLISFYFHRNSHSIFYRFDFVGFQSWELLYFQRPNSHAMCHSNSFLVGQITVADDKTKLCDSRENLQLSLQRICAVFK